MDDATSKNNNNAVVFSAQQNNVLGLQALNNVRMKMISASVGKNSNSVRDQVILHDLSDQLSLMHRSGFTFEEISDFLYGCGINLTADRISDYHGRVYFDRLLCCEKMILGNAHAEADQSAIRAAFVESHLRRALNEEHGMFLNYQPQVNMHTGVVVGAEALLRWNIDGVIFSPIEAIPIAEKSGLIIPIGAWVLRQACREAKRWQDMNLGGLTPIKVAVNLSQKQFSQNLPETIHGVICDVGLSPTLLGLEITESFLADNSAFDILRDLRESGMALSLDDFGTGYSCLSSLKNMPLDTIKIDRSFIHGLEDDGSSLAIVEMIIELARKLDMSTLAEGVESEGQAKILRSMGCSIAQGFLYSKPLSADEFVKFVGNNYNYATLN